MATRPRPLWARVLTDKAARKFLNKHKEEFADASFVPDDIAFSDSFLPGNKFIFEVVRDGRPYADPVRDKLAKLWLENLPLTTIAQRMGGWNRRKVYNKLKLLKLHALTKWRRARRLLLNARDATPSLDSSPAACAYRTTTLRMGDQERTVYLMVRDDEAFWVDAAGERYPDDIQDILNALPEEAQAFEALHVEE